MVLLAMKKDITDSIKPKRKSQVRRFRQALALVIAPALLAIAAPGLIQPIEAQASRVVQAEDNQTPSWANGRMYGWFGLGPVPPRKGWLTITTQGWVWEAEGKAKVMLPFVRGDKKIARKDYEANGLTAIIEERQGWAWDTEKMRLFTLGRQGTFQTKDASLIDAFVKNPPSVASLDKQYKIKTLVEPLPKGALSHGDPIVGRRRDEMESFVQRMRRSKAADSLEQVLGKTKVEGMPFFSENQAEQLSGWLGLYQWNSQKRVYLDPTKISDEENLFEAYIHELWHFFQEQNIPIANQLLVKVPELPLEGVYGSMLGIKPDNKVGNLRQAIEQQAQEFLMGWNWLRITSRPGFIEDEAKALMTAYTRLYPGTAVMVEWLLEKPLWQKHPLKDKPETRKAWDFENFKKKHAATPASSEASQGTERKL